MPLSSSAGGQNILNMRIWKRLLGLALCLCAAVCVMSVSASTADHTHPICGAAHTDIGDHTGPCENVTWAEWSGTNEITYTDNTACVYLSDTATPSSTLKVSNGQTLNLCLNGKTLSRSSTVIEVKGNATLNICDCQGGGGITISSGCVIKVDTKDDGKKPVVLGTATLNLYGGKLSTDDTHDSGTVKLYNNNGNEPRTVAVFNMYGGEVHNKDSGESAVYASFANIGTGYYNINMYGGSVTCEKGNGFKLNNNENITMQITGGTITGGRYGVGLSSQNTLTLAGNPKFIDTAFYSGTANISIPGDVTLTVKDDFAPAEETKVSVRKSVDSSGSVVFAAPAEGNNSLSSKAQHFVSAKEGYFVECADGVNLQLTACAITEQPTVNDYTVTANGGAKATYQWYSVTKGDVPVTSKNATTKDFSSDGDVGEWSCFRRAENGDLVSLGAFTLHMNAGDKLTLTEARGVEGFSLADSNNNPVDPVESSWTSCTYAAPADGEYTLTVTARPESFDENNYHLRPSFKATVTADVPDTALSDQTAATLNTTGLPSGSYICKVTWENKTTLNSQAVSYTAPQHTHRWSTDWTSDATNHWHKCFICNDKNDIVAHTYDQEVAVDGYKKSDATCTAKATYYKSCICGAKGTETFESGGLLAHDFTGGTWKSDANNHWKNCANCDAESDKVQHNFSKSGNTYTCTACGYAYTVPSPSSSSGGSSTPAITVPVSGSGDTVHVSASVSGSTAEVKEIKSAELDKIGTDSAVVIDLSGLNKGVTGVTLSTDTIDSICKTEADGVTVKLPSAELRVDRQTLAAVTEQAAGSKIRLVVEPDGTARSTMTAAQRSALDGMRNAAVLEAYFVSDGTRIHDFKGGSVELSIPYQASGALRAWFLKEDGTREPVSARYDKENALLILHHFSHYVIEELDSSAAYTVCAKDDSCPLGAFGDLTATAWYHDGIHSCVEKGLMHGISADKFLPDGSVTRAQLAAILWRLEGNPVPVSTADFSDVADGAWYAEAVRWAAGSGVVKGYADGRFRPNDAVTREQMATLLYRFAGYKGYDGGIGGDTDILRFVDGAAVGGYAVPAMRWACGSGLMTGAQRDGGMALAPRDTATRAQTATLLTRFQSTFAKEP